MRRKWRFVPSASAYRMVDLIFLQRRRHYHNAHFDIIRNALIEGIFLRNLLMVYYPALEEFQQLSGFFLYIFMTRELII